LQDAYGSETDETDETEIPEAIPVDPIPEPPSAIAWQVWTYLERHRKDTLRCIGTFDSEWKAQRFIAEAERQNRDRLRVHYEIIPLLELEDEESPNGTGDRVDDEVLDAIDVEIMTDSL
jgi:hypothetical protein